MNYEQKSTSSNQEHEYQNKVRLINDTEKQEQEISASDADESEEQYPSALNSYPRHLFHFACSLSHLYGRGLNLKLLSLHSKLSKSCLKSVPRGPRHFLSKGLGPKLLGLHSKSTWLILQATQRRYLMPQGTVTFPTTS
jgi:hypothetical protein